MQAGTLEHRINILKPVIVKSETGTETTTYEHKYSCRAAVKVNTGTRENENQEMIWVHSVIFTIRRFWDFDELHRVEYDGKMYRIISIDKDRHLQNIAILTEQIND